MIPSLNKLNYAGSSLSAESPRRFAFEKAVQVTMSKVCVEDEYLFDRVCQVLMMSPP